MIRAYIIYEGIMSHIYQSTVFGERESIKVYFSSYDIMDYDIK